MNLFNEIKSYVGFTRADEDRLGKLGPVLEPHYNKVVESFYDRLEKHPRAQGVFTGPEQVERLRVSLHDWLGGVFGGEYDAAYFKKRQRIGQAHVDVGLLPQFMFGAMNLIRTEFVQVILDQAAADVERVLGNEDCGFAVTSVDRILDIELTIMVQSYWNTLMKQKLAIPAALATGLAHEVRNPLNAIGLQMTLLERRLRSADIDGAIYEPVLDAVQAELRRIQGLNSEILDFAKPVDVHFSTTDLTEIIDEIQRAHQLTLDAGEIDMEIISTGDVVLECDKNRLGQVFVNLLTNAVEAMPDGGEIKVKIEGRSGAVVVDFIDSGQGMSPALKYKIFDLFHTTKAAGTGIGLAIARKIVEAHAGSIDVMSHPGQGTTFTVYLPRVR